MMWKVPSEFGESTRRTIAPTCYSNQYIIHNNSYKLTLRLGILFKSKSESGTTFGIPFLGPDGKQWFTLAEHGFKLESDEEVYHSSYVARDNSIGIVKHTT